MQTNSGARFFTSGFTLIELMIVVTVIGILSIFAVPTYQNYTMRANRTAAKQFLLTIANKQEQYLLDSRCYAASVAALNLTAPAELNNKYTVAFTAVSACPVVTVPSFTVEATAIGSQVSDGWLRLDNLSAKTSQYPGKW